MPMQVLTSIYQVIDFQRILLLPWYIWIPVLFAAAFNLLRAIRGILSGKLAVPLSRIMAVLVLLIMLTQFGTIYDAFYGDTAKAIQVSQ
jgi:hypothetical protein